MPKKKTTKLNKTRPANKTSKAQKPNQTNEASKTGKATNTKRATKASNSNGDGRSSGTINTKPGKSSLGYAFEIGSEIASTAIGTGTIFGAISGAGTSGLSAAGITSGLATLGAGSMLGGIIVAPALGYGAYRLSRWAFATKSST